MTLPPDLELRTPTPADEPAIAEMIAACDESYRSWAPPGWEPPARGSELDRWNGRITDGSSWARIAVEPGGRVVGLVSFTQALTWVPEDPSEGEPIAGRAHVAAVFTHPERWREGIAASLLEIAEQQMRSEGFHELQLWTPRHAPAQRFYEACGWWLDGREQWSTELALELVGYLKRL